MDPVQSRMDNLTIGDFQDKTEFVRSLSANLECGQIIMDPSFSLLNALSAIEIMDPKMDSGMLSSSNPLYSPTMCASFSPGFKDLALIGHRLFRAEATWWTGKTLAQTVFSGYFTHDATLISHPLLSLLVRSTMASMEMFIEICNYANIVFDEDLIRDMHGVLALKQNVNKIISELETSISLLKNTHLNVRLKVEEEDDDDDVKYIRFICQIFDFKKWLLSLFKRINDGEMDEKLMLKFLERIQSSLDFELVFEVPDQIFGFEDLATKRLSLVTPLSPITLLPFDSSRDLIRQICSDLAFVADHKENVSTLHVMIDFMFKFAQKRPNIVTRAITYSWCTQNSRMFSKQPLRFISDSIFEITGFSFPQDKDVPDIDTKQFKSFSNDLLFDTFRVFSFNMGRMRRKLLKLIPLWDELQTEAETIDTHLSEKGITEKENYAIANWIYSIKLIFCEISLLSGFNLELYKLGEIASVYLYLDYLYTHQIKNHHRCHLLKKEKSNEFRELFIIMKQETCRGLFRFLAALKKEGLLHVGKMESEHEKGRYLHRFKYILSLGSPQGLDYEGYAMNADTSNYETCVLLDNAATGFETAKVVSSKLLGGLNVPTRFMVDVGTENMISDLKKVAFANGISVTVTKAKLQALKEENAKTSMDTKYSAQFVLITNK